MTTITRTLTFVSSLLASLALSACDIPTDKCNKGNGGLFDTGPIVVDFTCGDTGSSARKDTGETDSVETGDTGETGETGDSDTDTAVDTDTDTDTAIDPIDADGDGFNADDDCDDANPAINPNAAEVCDGKDNDCDGHVDDDDDSVSGQSTWYADDDGDGYGDPAFSSLACEGGTRVSDSSDCDDADASVHPGADETDCAGTVDYNCDGSVGSDDADADGFLACDDCDDSEAAANPDGTEVCDGLDNDCEGTVDIDAADELAWYADSDGDSYGDPDSSTSACDEPTGYVADSTDCNDAAAAAFPGGVEVCDDLDNDCNGVEDDNTAIDAATWHRDADSDRYGDATDTVTQCDAPSGYITENSDCDDTDAAVNPAATEACNGYDDDCDEDVDEAGSTGETTWYSDADLDGFGDPSVSQSACDQPNKYVADATDCDDASADAFPGALETCDGADENCDGSIDNGAVDVLTWYADTDADGYGDSSLVTEGCSAPAGYVSDSTDCDDGDIAVSPAATQDCNSGLDQDCDGAVSFSDFDCGSGYFGSENLFNTGGSWNGESSVGVGSVGNWIAVSGAAPGTSCSTAYDDSCSLALAGPGTWSVTSDVSSTAADVACVFSVASSAASTTVNYSIGSESGSVFATNSGWRSQVVPYFTGTGTVTFQVTITSASTLYVDSVICVD